MEGGGGERLGGGRVWILKCLQSSSINVKLISASGKFLMAKFLFMVLHSNMS